MKKHTATQEHEDFTKLKQLQRLILSLKATHEAHNVSFETKNAGNEIIISLSFRLKRIDNPVKIRGQLRYRFVKPTYRAKPSELFYTRGNCGVVFFRREVADMFRGLTDKQRNDVSEIVALMLDCAQATALKRGVISVPEVC